MRNLLLLLTLLAGSVISAQAATLNVMTSYPQPVVNTFQEAFEEAHPDTQLNILWRRPDDALKTLLASKTAGVDVVWMPSITTFTELADQQLLQPLKLNLTGLPQTIGGVAIADPKRRYLPFEMAGYGLLVDKTALKQAKLSMPNRWQDLTNLAWHGHIALPIPSQLGFAPLMIDQLLQHHGWQTGWMIWQQIAANSHLVSRDDAFITEQIYNGQAITGLLMDFFVLTSQQDASRYAFIYPESTAFNPAHIGMTVSTAQPELAQTFIEFMLSEQGQQLLLSPDVGRLPVRADLYDAQAITINPFKQNHAGQYDPKLSRDRRGYVNMLFDAAITEPHALLEQAWTTLKQHQANPAFQSHSAALQEIQKQLAHWPVAEPEADTKWLEACADYGHADNAVCEQEKQRLMALFKQQYQHAIKQLNALQATR